jgi:uncharacterized protein involved in response to NO
MTGIVWTWSPWWYFQIALAFFIWLPLFVYRKSWKRKGEIREQLLFGFLAFGITFFSDVSAIFTNLWHYSDGDWPAILLFLMFFVGVGGFQIFKFIDERWNK